MDGISLNTNGLKYFIQDSEYQMMEKNIYTAHDMLENKSGITFDMFDNYWLVEIVSREPFGDDGYYYQIKVVGTSDYGYQVSDELFSIGELALVIEFENNKTFMIGFNN